MGTSDQDDIQDGGPKLWLAANRSFIKQSRYHSNCRLFEKLIAIELDFKRLK